MLRPLLYLIFFVSVSYGTALGTLQVLEAYFISQNGNTYFDSIGDEYEGNGRIKPLELVKLSFSRKDNLLVFGSCEMGKEDVNSAFLNKNNGFQVNKIGMNGANTIMNVMSLGAIDEDISGKKIVYLSSASFFRKTGITLDRFDWNFSERKFYAFMFNKNLSHSLKKRLAKRVFVLSKSKKFLLVNFYARIFSSENKMSSVLSKLAYPIYYLRYKALIVRDEYAVYQKLNEYRQKGIPEVIQPVSKKHDWEKEKLITLEKEKKNSHNEFHVLDDFYMERVLNNQLERFKFDLSADSPEREDFLIFLEVCKELKVVPLIVNLPHHGKIADHFDLKYQIGNRKQRIELNKWIKETVESYNFELADFSVHEYTDYFNSRYTTTGSYGLVYVNEAISKFYNNS